MNKKKDYKAAIKSLDEFIQQIYWGEDIAPEESKKNIKEGLIKILVYSQNTHGISSSYNSNGLLITEDGYFLTAKHCINHKLSDLMMIEDGKGRTYGIEKICAVSKKEEDIALGKIKIEKKSKPIKYRLYNTNQLKLGLPVAILYYNNDGKLETKYGLIKQIWNDSKVDLLNGRFTSFPDQFVIDLNKPAEPGHSGGVIISPDGRLVGILSTADVSGETNIAGGVKFFKALELIDFYKRKLIEKTKNGKNK